MMISLRSRLERRAGDWAFLGPILAATLLIRILAGLWVDAWDGPDWGSYVGSARDLLGGRGLTSSYHPPLYSIFISAVFGVFGESLRAVQTLQALLSVFVAWAVYRLAREVGGARAGYIAAAIYAVYVPSIAFRQFAGPVYLSSENLFIPLFLAVLTILVRGGPGLLRWGAAGVLLGLACLARPVGLLFPGLLMLWGPSGRRSRACEGFPGAVSPRLTLRWFSRP